MSTLAAFYSAAYDTIKRRILSLYQYGPKQVYEAMPWGDDSNPPQGAIAVMMETDMDNAPVVVGYINKNQLAAPGEKRFYAVDANGNQVFYTWMKADGTFELGGTNDFAVRFNALNEGLQDHVSFLQEQLVLISAGIATGGGSYTPGNVDIDISAAKIDEIKTL